MSIMDDIRREADQQGVTPYKMAKATEGVIGKSTAYRAMADPKADLQLSTLKALCDVLGLSIAVRRESHDNQRPGAAGC